MLILSPRLKSVADMVFDGRKTVDIGTDHAYLPAYLIINGITEQVLACDIGELPLKNAEKTLQHYSLQGKIELRISDGLKNVHPHEAEQITVCGMGGTLMSQILDDAEWIRREGMHLVLQPMTHSEDIREFLCKNGFEISEEKYVSDSGHTYCCIAADYTGKIRIDDPGFYYFGYSLDYENIAADYIGRQICRVKKKYQGMTSSGITNEYTEILHSVIEYYEKRTTA